MANKATVDYIDITVRIRFNANITPRKGMRFIDNCVYDFEIDDKDISIADMDILEFRLNEDEQDGK